jgi:ferrochelatase
MAGATTAVLLVNLGTPRSPSPRDVRRYLREFLADPLVLDMPALARFLLLELVILPFRPAARPSPTRRYGGRRAPPAGAWPRARAGQPGYAVELGALRAELSARP